MNYNFTAMPCERDVVINRAFTIMNKDIAKSTIKFKTEVKTFEFKNDKVTDELFSGY